MTSIEAIATINITLVLSRSYGYCQRSLRYECAATHLAIACRHAVHGGSCGYRHGRSGCRRDGDCELLRQRLLFGAASAVARHIRDNALHLNRRHVLTCTDGRHRYQRELRSKNRNACSAGFVAQPLGDVHLKKVRRGG